MTYIIEHNGLYKRPNGRPWDTFSLAKEYQSEARANVALTRLGRGRIMEKRGTEEETREGAYNDRSRSVTYGANT